MSSSKPRMRHPRRQPKKQSQLLMSPHTKDFLQKICYKRAASVDMTQHGFISDSKVSPVNLLLKPLREKLETICGPRSNASRCPSLKMHNLRDGQRPPQPPNVPKSKLPPPPRGQVKLCLPAAIVKRNTEKKLEMVGRNATKY